MAVLLILLVARAWRQPPAPAPAPAGRSAAIVDQVALTLPNPAFTEEALAYLIEAGFNVDVFEGEDVTVELYRTLPDRGYDLILFRTHSTKDLLDAELAGEPVYLYTGERHDRLRYTYQQLTRQIMAGRVLYEEQSPALFIVGPEFVRQTMRGRFNDTLMLIGGCDSLSTTALADAFLERGAGAIIGWNGLVDVAHNDRALLYLLRLLTVDRVPLEQAVTRARAELGPDPTFRSLPVAYPQDRDSDGSGLR